MIILILQLASCENVLGVNIYAQIIFNMFQKQTSSNLWLLFQIKSCLSLHHVVLLYLSSSGSGDILFFPRASVCPSV